MDRYIEIEEFLLVPVYQLSRDLEQDIPLDYPPPVFAPGRSAEVSSEKTEMWIIVDNAPAERQIKTVGGSMRCTPGTMMVAVSTPVQIPRSPVGKNQHKVTKQLVARLADHYSYLFCDDVRQFYTESVFWRPEVDKSSNRTLYVLRVDYRYYDYLDGQGEVV